jgi:hypothetical protein
VTAACVSAVWGVLTASDLYWVSQYSINLPLVDEWVMVPVLTGHEPVSLSWIWSQHNEHRLPLTRLLLLGVYRIGGCDFRSGVWLNVALMSVLAALMILAARRLRGRTLLADAFFPLALLEWGQAENFLWTWQLVFMVPAFVAGVALFLVVTKGPNYKVGAGAAYGVSVLSLALCGAIGLVMVPPLLLWLAWLGVRAWRSEGQRASGLVFLGLGAAALLVLGVYFVGFERPRGLPTPSLAESPAAVVQFLSLGFGLIRTDWWEHWAIATALLLGAGVWLLGRTIWSSPGERSRSLGLLCFLGAIGCMALAVGWGRAGHALAARYSTLAAPVLCALYFVAQLYADPPMRRVVQYTLLVLTAGMLWRNTTLGLEYARGLRAKADGFEADLRSGLPPMVLADRYSRYPFGLYPSRSDLAQFMKWLRKAGIGPFRDLATDPEHRVIELTDSASPTAAEHHLTLKEPGFVYGIWLRYQYQPQQPFAQFRLTWKEPDGTSRNYETLLQQDPREQSILVWVNGPLAEFTAAADDKPCLCRLWDFRILAPIDKGAGKEPQRSQSSPRKKVDQAFNESGKIFLASASP